MRDRLKRAVQEQVYVVGELHARSGRFIEELSHEVEDYESGLIGCCGYTLMIIDESFW